VFFQVSAIADNDRGPRYTEAVLNSLHEINRERRWVCLQFGSHQGTVGLFVRVPAELVTTFTHDFADAYPGCTLAALPDVGRDAAEHIWSATLRLSPDVFPLKTHRQFEDLLHRELPDPLAGLLSALRARPKGCVASRIALVIRPCRASWYRSAGASSLELSEASDGIGWSAGTRSGREVNGGMFEASLGSSAAWLVLRNRYMTQPTRATS
jgi:hypothetical protein